VLELHLQFQVLLSHMQAVAEVVAGFLILAAQPLVVAVLVVMVAKIMELLEQLTQEEVVVVLVLMALPLEMVEQVALV
tara:strand:- start:4 stop:237 length:234 start_codon:yes stop_codon:yes gene_type:complete